MTPPRRRRSAPLAAASATLIALAAAGCGSGGTPSAASSSATTTSPSATAGQQQLTTVPPTATSGPPRPAAPATTGTPSSSAVQPNAASARCTVTELRMRLGAGDAGAGNVYYPLRFTNISDHTCTLDGFPGVSLIRGDGSVIGKPADRQGSTGAAVSVAPGRTVQADLHTLNKGVKGDSCWREPTFLMAYPPGSKDAMTLATATPVVCGDTFDVSTVH